ncbi:MAG: hypothetical protein NTX37_04685 [Burkholderiales bacterium]|jgi:hypothetical protein|nr:hypothetical protein [Burkholderiales bacterium]
MQSIEERRIIYYLPLLRTEASIQLSDFKITPFLKDKEYSHLLPVDVFDGTGSLIEFNGFESNDFFTQEIDKKTFIALERLKFSYFFHNPSHVMCIDGYVSSETFECFRCREPSDDPAFEHKVHFSNGMYSFSESLKTYYSSRASLKLQPITPKTGVFDYVDYFNKNTAEESHLTAMRLYNRCWSTYSIHNSIDKPVLARASIEILAKLKFPQDPLKKFIPDFFETAFLKLNQLGNSDATVHRLTELISQNRDSLQNMVTEQINFIKDARHSFAHEGIETEALTNIPFYLVWFPLYWMVLLQADKMTAKDGVRLALFFCLLKIRPEYWQHIDHQPLPNQTKRSHLDAYAYYSRILPKWSETRPEETKIVLSSISKWFSI